TCKRGMFSAGIAVPSLGFARAVWQTPNRANPFSPARGEKVRGDIMLLPRLAVGRASFLICDRPATRGKVLHRVCGTIAPRPQGGTSPLAGEDGRGVLRAPLIRPSLPAASSSPRCATRG